MRIIGGRHKGRKLNTPKNNLIRPTSDKVRQAIFNSLHSRGVVHDAHVLDGYCGTGALGIEALSQGASFCTFLDKNPSSMKICKDNITLIDEQSRCNFIITDTAKLKPYGQDTKPASLIFLDPPYNKNLLEPTITTLINGNWLAEDAFFILETDKKENFNHPAINVLDEKKYGDTLIRYGLYQS